MKANKYLLLITLIIGLGAGTAQAQNDLKVPLSDPGSPGKLVLSTVFSEDIAISAYDGNEVIILFDGEDEDENDLIREDGLRKISNSGVGMEVSEDDNVVRIKTAPNTHDLDLEVRVPRNFSLQLQVTHGDIYVEGVNGEHEIKSTNGDIEMENISGSVIAASTNGDIELDMTSVTSNTPMSLTSLNGDIDVYLPSKTKFTAKMKTDFGEVLTNFDIALDRTASETQVNSEGGKYTVTINKWVKGDVNGGGPEFLFKTYNGDIVIRKKS